MALSPEGLSMRQAARRVPKAVDPSTMPATFIAWCFLVVPALSTGFALAVCALATVVDRWRHGDRALYSTYS